MLSFLLPTLACTGPDPLPDPRTLPYRFEVVWENRFPTIPVDFNGDGQDEFVHYSTAGAISPSERTTLHGAVVLLTHRGEAIDQLNYSGTVLFPRALDVTGDGLPELLVPVVRGDSLFLSIADGRGRKLQSFLLATGQARVEPEGIIPWDPIIVDFHAVDTNGDGRTELVSVISTRLARLPRGVLIHDLRDGSLLGEAVVGAAIPAYGWKSQTLVGDFDGDGVLDLLVATVSPNNGAVAGGFDDRHTYLIMFRLAPTVEVAWSRQMGGLGSWVRMAYADFTGDGRQELLTLRTSNSTDESRLELIEPGTWRTIRQRSFAENVSPFGFVALDLNGDSRSEIVVSTRAGEVLVLDGALSVLRRRKFSSGVLGLAAVPDLDGDGRGEVVAGIGGLALLGPDLRITARAENIGWSWAGPSIVRTGVGSPVHLLNARAGGIVTFRLVPVPFAWFWRWGRWALLSLGGVALLGVASGLVVTRRSARLQRAVQTLAVDAAPHGLLLATRSGRVRWVNETLRRWLGGLEAAPARGTPLEEVLAGAPEALAFCRKALATAPARHSEIEGSYYFGGEPRELRMIAEPVLSGQRGGPFWLIRFEDLTGEIELREARGWAAVAEAVAHDFHTPLTGINLELDRIRRRLRQLDYEAARDLDSRAADVKDRVTRLIQRTDELRQVLGTGELRIEQVALNELLCDAGEELRRALPEEIELDLRPARDAPRVQIDPRLMQSVLKNLVENAVEAMHEGGTITISTALVRGARVVPDNPPRDYARLEVTDCGSGIPAELIGRIFDPGVTSRPESGWGIGLATARRIVEGHHGIIRATSEPGVGSAFTIYLPVEDAAFEHDPAARSEG